MKLYSLLMIAAAGLASPVVTRPNHLRKCSTTSQMLAPTPSVTWLMRRPMRGRIWPMRRRMLPTRRPIVIRGNCGCRP